MGNASSHDWDTWDTPVRTSTPDLSMPESDDEYAARLAGSHQAADEGLAGWFNRRFAPEAPLTPREVAVFVGLAAGSLLLFLSALIIVIL